MRSRLTGRSGQPTVTGSRTPSAWGGAWCLYLSKGVPPRECGAPCRNVVLRIGGRRRSVARRRNGQPMSYRYEQLVKPRRRAGGGTARENPEIAVPGQGVGHAIARSSPQSCAPKKVDALGRVRRRSADASGPPSRRFAAPGKGDSPPALSPRKAGEAPAPRPGPPCVPGGSRTRASGPGSRPAGSRGRSGKDRRPGRSPARGVRWRHRSSPFCRHCCRDGNGRPRWCTSACGTASGRPAHPGRQHPPQRRSRPGRAVDTLRFERREAPGEVMHLRSGPNGKRHARGPLGMEPTVRCDARPPQPLPAEDGGGAVCPCDGHSACPAAHPELQAH